MDYNLFDFVYHGNRICILVDFDEKSATLAYIHFYGDDGTFCAIEYDTTEEVKLCNEEASPIMERLRAYRMFHDDIFGFAEEELCLIHYF